MATEFTPQSIREVRFREKLRGYHPEDVDEFVANVAATVEALQRRVAELAGGDAVAARAAGGDDVEESLKRTLVLAQRTADLAVQEAREEAARMLADATAERDNVLNEAESLRSRTMNELENELSSYRQRLQEERDALQRDVNALHAYVAQERERLRIYFSEQLRRVEQGVPGLDVPPETEAPAAPTAVAVAPGGLPDEYVAPPPPEVASPGEEGDDDQFLAELRRAVHDTEPLGPRDDEGDVAPRGERDVDIFNDDDGGGRFLRRRR